MKCQGGTVKFRFLIVVIWHLGDEEGQKEGGVYITEKKLQNTGEAVIHSQQHAAFMSLKSFKIRLSYENGFV